MTERHDVTIQAQGWIEKADHDLINAEYVLTLSDNCPTDTVCFHAQQRAEKCLKALLIFREVDFPGTHDLVVLINLLGGAKTLCLRIEDVQPLNRYSVETRYPGEWGKIDVEEARNAVGMARKIRSAVQNALSEGD
jgi:HEPN domain-containing protein